MTTPAFLDNPDRACLGTKTDLFFADHKALRINARRICYGCPFRTDCLQWAVHLGIRDGIWAGVNFASEKERERAKAGIPEPPPKPIKPDPVVVARAERERLYTAVRQGWEKELSDGQIALPLGRRLEAAS